MTANLDRYEYIEGERSPGFGAGLFALVLSVVPAAWVAVFQAVPAEVADWMLTAEPIAFPVVGAVALLAAVVALVRNRPAGKVLGGVALLLLAAQLVTILVLLR